MSAHFASLHIDNHAPEPLWRQLYIQLDDLLTSGAVQAGTSLPPERELAETLGVSRSTVKRSYDQLRHDQRIGGRGRAGSVVRRPSRSSPRWAGSRASPRRCASWASSPPPRCCCARW